MTDDLPESKDPLEQALYLIAHADRAEEIERVVAEHPILVKKEFLDQLDHQIDEIEQTHTGDWWALTRARLLLGGSHDGTLDDALFRCRTRDLLLLGPEDVRRRVEGNPDLLIEHADRLLQYWASHEHPASQRATQIELRRGLLRELAAERSSALVATAMAQEQEFHRSGDLAALNRALATRKYLLRDLSAPFVSAEVRTGHAQAVSRMLQARFHVTGALQDIDNAITEAKQSVVALPLGHQLREILLAELGNAFNTRFRELQDRADISRAIAIFEGLVALPNRHVLDPEDRLTSQVNLAVALLDRYYFHRTRTDLDRAVGLMREVVKATPAASARRFLRIGNLGSALYVVFRDTGDREALREAITLQRQVAETEDAVPRVHALTALARSLNAAAQIGEGTAEESAALFRQACRAGLEVNVGAAMWAGMTWGREAWSRSTWDAAAEAYGYCADGARLLFSRQSGEASQEIRLSQFREVAPRVAFALAGVGRIDEAAVAFELSRAQLLVQAVERGQSLHRAPDLDAELQTGDLSETAVTRRAFSIDDIKRVARDAPLLYLVYTDQGGLALLVRHDKVESISLSQLDAKKVEEKVHAFLAGLKSSNFQDVLRVLDETTRWLWDAVMGPVLEALPGADGVVLVAGGLLGLLPLHAAWTPSPDRPTRRRYALDTIVFSYAPSARAIGLVRAPAMSAIDATTINKPLIVANPAYLTEEPLQFAAEEADIVKWLFPTAQEMLDENASLRQVSDALSAAQFVHLACHGFADLRTPLDSGIILAGDETLSVRKIRDLHINARLAVLSACETAVAGTELPDEIVALPTGLIQAGVAGVIASLWQVPDAATAMLMAEFYRRLCREKHSPASALRGAQQWLRDTTNAEKARLWEASAGDWLPSNVAQRFRASLDVTAERGYLSPWWWGAFTHVGAQSI